MAFLSFFIVQILLFSVSHSVIVNIHVKATAPALQEAMTANARLQEFDPTLSIHFETVHYPHVTLYMTDFKDDCINDLQKDIRNTLADFHRFQIDQPAYANLSGTYVLWNSVKAPYLQALSDAIVRATSKHAKPNQPIPQWIMDLPDPEIREKKIKYVKEYGSPNVFDQFDPHITLGCDFDKEALKSAFDRLTVEQKSWTVNVLALGTSGVCGTVQRGMDLGFYFLSQ